MGQSESKGIAKYGKDFSDLTIFDAIEHSNFGKFYPAEYKGTEKRHKLLIKEKPVSSIEQGRRLYEYCSRSERSKQSSFLHVYGHTVESLEGFLGKTTQVKIFMQPFEESLSDDIRTRSDAFIYFKEKEIMQIVQIVVEGLYELKITNVKHLNIQPRTLLKTKQGYKLYHPLVVNSSKDNIKLALAGDKRTHISPEMHPLNPNYDEKMRKPAWRCDIFSLGLVILDMASLEVENKYYYQQGVLNTGQITKILREMSDKYSPSIVTMTAQMLSTDLESRTNIETLTKLLDEYKNEGLNANTIEQVSILRIQFDANLKTRMKLQTKKSLISSQRFDSNIYYQKQLIQEADRQDQIRKQDGNETVVFSRRGTDQKPKLRSTSKEVKSIRLSGSRSKDKNLKSSDRLLSNATRLVSIRRNLPPKIAPTLPLNTILNRVQISGKEPAPIYKTNPMKKSFMDEDNEEFQLFEEDAPTIPKNNIQTITRTSLLFDKAAKIKESDPQKYQPQQKMIETKVDVSEIDKMIDEMNRIQNVKGLRQLHGASQPNIHIPQPNQVSHRVINQTQPPVNTYLRQKINGDTTNTMKYPAENQGSGLRKVNSYKSIPSTSKLPVQEVHKQAVPTSFKTLSASKIYKKNNTAQNSQRTITLTQQNNQNAQIINTTPSNPQKQSSIRHVHHISTTGNNSKVSKWKKPASSSNSNSKLPQALTTSTIRRHILGQISQDNGKIQHVHHPSNMKATKQGTVTRRVINSSQSRYVTPERSLNTHVQTNGSIVHKHHTNQSSANIIPSNQVITRSTTKIQEGNKIVHNHITPQNNEQNYRKVTRVQNGLGQRSHSHNALPRTVQINSYSKNSLNQNQVLNKQQISNNENSRTVTTTNNYTQKRRPSLKSSKQQSNNSINNTSQVQGLPASFRTLKVVNNNQNSADSRQNIYKQKQPQQYSSNGSTMRRGVSAGQIPRSENSLQQYINSRQVVQNHIRGSAVKSGIRHVHHTTNSTKQIQSNPSHRFVNGKLVPFQSESSKRETRTTRPSLKNSSSGNIIRRDSSVPNVNNQPQRSSNNIIRQSSHSKVNKWDKRKVEGKILTAEEYQQLIKPQLKSKTSNAFFRPPKPSKKVHNHITSNNHNQNNNKNTNILQRVTIDNTDLEFSNRSPQKTLNIHNNNNAATTTTTTIKITSDKKENQNQINQHRNVQEFQQTSEEKIVREMPQLNHKRNIDFTQLPDFSPQHQIALKYKNTAPPNSSIDTRPLSQDVKSTKTVVHRLMNEDGTVMRELVNYDEIPTNFFSEESFQKNYARENQALQQQKSYQKKEYKIVVNSPQKEQGSDQLLINNQLDNQLEQVMNEKYQTTHSNRTVKQNHYNTVSSPYSRTNEAYSTLGTEINQRIGSINKPTATVTAGQSPQTGKKSQNSGQKQHNNQRSGDQMSRQGAGGSGVSISMLLLQKFEEQRMKSKIMNQEGGNNNQKELRDIQENKILEDIQTTNKKTDPPLNSYSQNSSNSRNYRIESRQGSSDKKNRTVVNGLSGPDHHIQENKNHALVGKYTSLNNQESKQEQNQPQKVENFKNQEFQNFGDKKYPKIQNLNLLDQSKQDSIDPQRGSTSPNHQVFEFLGGNTTEDNNLVFTSYMETQNQGNTIYNKYNNANIIKPSLIEEVNSELYEEDEYCVDREDSIDDITDILKKNEDFMKKFRQEMKNIETTVPSTTKQSPNSNSPHYIQSKKGTKTSPHSGTMSPLKMEYNFLKNTDSKSPNYQGGGITNLENEIWKAANGGHTPTHQSQMKKRTWKSLRNQFKNGSKLRQSSQLSNKV